MAKATTVLSNEPRSWVENKIDGVILPATVGKEIDYDPTVERYRDTQDLQRINVYAEAEKAKAKLRAAMAKFQTTVTTKTNLSIDTTRYQAWDEVERLMEEVSRKYQEKRGSRLGCVGRFFDKVGNSGGTFNAWLSLLPNGDYSSVVCGAFKLVISAAIRVKAIRDTVFAALGSIPAIVAKANVYLEMWKSVDLHKAFSRLYTIILEVFEHIIAWLAEPGLLSVGKAFFKQDQYGDKLRSMIDNVGVCAKDVADEADICSQWVIGSINEKMDRQTKTIDGMKVTFEGMREGFGNNLDDVKHSQGRIEDGQARIEDRFNAFLALFQGALHDFKITHEVKPRMRIEQKSRALSQKIMRQILGFDPQLASRDVRRTIAEGHVFSLHDQERAEYLMNSAPFKTWLTSQDSRLMLVNGNAEAERISPASFACGLLSNALERSRATTILTFFCGLHTDSGDDDTGARQMLANLVGQLLEQYSEFDLSFLDPSQRTTLEEHDVDFLCNVLVSLVKQLPSGQIVFCMIDGISYYETRRLKEDSRTVINVLIDLVEDEGLQAIVKLMVSSPSRCRWASQTLARERIFNMPEDMEYTNQGFNTQSFGRKTRNQVQRLENDVQPEPQWPTDSSDEHCEDWG